MHHDTYSREGIARRVVLETKAQKAAGRRWMRRQDLTGYTLTIAALGTLDGLADGHGIATVKGGKARLNARGRIALSEARIRAAGGWICTMRRVHFKAQRPTRPVSYLPEVREVIALQVAA